MVTINFEIGGFDLAEVLKSVAGQTGVTINIYTLQELGEAPQGVEVISEYVEEDSSPIEEEIELIDENLSYEERSDFALQMREEGKSWKYIGRALGMSSKAAARRVNQWLRKKKRREASLANQKKQEKQRLEEEAKKETFEGFTTEELVSAIHGTVSAVKNSKDNGLFLSSDLAVILKDTVKRKYKKDDTVKKFNKTIGDTMDDLFRKVGLCLGRGAAITSTTTNEKGKLAVQIMVVNVKKMSSLEDVQKNMKKQGWL